MRYDDKYPEAKAGFDGEDAWCVTNSAPLGRCQRCGEFTRWLDEEFFLPACSEECSAALGAGE